MPVPPCVGFERWALSVGLWAAWSVVFCYRLLFIFITQTDGSVVLKIAKCSNRDKFLPDFFMFL